MRILVVEDDKALGRGVVAFLKSEGFTVDWVQTGESALDESSEPYAVIVLDVGLPDVSGFEVLAQLRRAGNRTPLLLLTARDALKDRITGLDLGADDYMLKPFEPEELAARLRALGRRRGGDPSPSVTVGNLVVERNSARARVLDRDLALRRREHTLLLILASNVGKVVPRTRLTGEIFGHDDEIGPNALDLYVGRVRRKLEPDGPRILTLRGQGYVLETA
ncbi:response regulator with CheY-like receiver domain and winged-helix DNA-binding domain [Caulobacter sp. AP07]|jgi:two-component system response regulator TctD|uniref:response regulator transcription factor n=1 Tax=Caulobacter sp. AP07 TaxID=1144304 RepID=UPI00027224DE|nr:response regulator transcription factor [Caulobacter sp. AP07]EJL36386.1 response regulator with CheY-like receiver domain and winged-helix DNA-binding domain [Caulobacter sp. AP07]